MFRQGIRVAQEMSAYRRWWLDAGWIAEPLDTHKDTRGQHEQSGCDEHHCVHRVGLSRLIATHSFARLFDARKGCGRVTKRKVSKRQLVELGIDAIAFANVASLKSGEDFGNRTIWSNTGHFEATEILTRTMDFQRYAFTHSSVLAERNFD